MLSSRMKKAGIVAAAGFLIVMLLWDLLDPLPSANMRGDTARAESGPATSTVPTATASPPAVITNPPARYAIALDRVRGLPPAAAPGTAIDLWVSWEPPVTKRPRLQKLLESVIVEEIADPVVPGGSRIVLLAVREDQVSDLLWADRYGSLSATVVSGQN